MVAQQFVALLQGAGVANKVVEVDGIGLRDNLIHEPAALLAGAADQFLIGRSCHYQRKRAYVRTEAVVFLPLAFERFAFARHQPHRQLFVEPLAGVVAAQGYEIFAASHQRAVGEPGEAFAETQVIDRVEQIALAHAVVAQKTVDFRAEIEPGVGYILEVCYGEAVEKHNRVKGLKEGRRRAR